MERSITRWTTVIVTAAVLSVPVTGFAQSPTPSQPPSQSQDPTTGPPAQPPAAATPRQMDADAAKQHLTAARNALSQLTQMPEASQLTGEVRTQVSELISNFNALITTTADWPAAYAKVEATLTSLIGPKGAGDEPPARTTGTEGAVGTTGTSGLHPEIRAKLVEFRDHLEKFEQAAGGVPASNAASTSTPPSPAGSQPATPSTTAGQEPSAPQSSPIDRDAAMQHIQAIEAILSGQLSAAGTPGAAGTTGTEASSPITLDSARVRELRSHLAELRRIIGQDR